MLRRNACTQAAALEKGEMMPDEKAKGHKIPILARGTQLSLLPVFSCLLSAGIFSCNLDIHEERVNFAAQVELY
jgi:hypothetical protein